MMFCCWLCSANKFDTAKDFLHFHLPRICFSSIRSALFSSARWQGVSRNENECWKHQPRVFIFHYIFCFPLPSPDPPVTAPKCNALFILREWSGAQKNNKNCEIKMLQNLIMLEASRVMMFMLLFLLIILFMTKKIWWSEALGNLTSAARTSAFHIFPAQVLLLLASMDRLKGTQFSGALIISWTHILDCSPANVNNIVVIKERMYDEELMKELLCRLSADGLCVARIPLQHTSLITQWCIANRKRIMLHVYVRTYHSSEYQSGFSEGMQEEDF